LYELLLNATIKIESIFKAKFIYSSTFLKKSIGVNYISSISFSMPLYDPVYLIEF